jgi:hypothetical protein
MAQVPCARVGVEAVEMLWSPRVWFHHEATTTHQTFESHRPELLVRVDFLRGKRHVALALRRVVAAHSVAGTLPPDVLCDGHSVPVPGITQA